MEICTFAQWLFLKHFHVGNAVRGMISILDEWVKRNYGVEALHPCWHSLVYVVADAIGGGNPAAASNIARNWKGMLYVGICLYSDYGSVDVYIINVCSLVPSPSFFARREARGALCAGKKKEGPGIHCLRM